MMSLHIYKIFLQKIKIECYDRKDKRLVQKLQEATDNRKLAWEKTSRDNEYQAVVGDNSV